MRDEERGGDERGEAKVAEALRELAPTVPEDQAYWDDFGRGVATACAKVDAARDDAFVRRSRRRERVRGLVGGTLLTAAAVLVVFYVRVQLPHEAERTAAPTAPAAPVASVAVTAAAPVDDEVDEDEPGEDGDETNADEDLDDMNEGELERVYARLGQGV